MDVEDEPRCPDWVERGTRIRLLHSPDPYSSLETGDEGTVQLIDDEGTIHVKWDNGEKLGLILGVDEFEKIG